MLRLIRSIFRLPSTPTNAGDLPKTRKRKGYYLELDDDSVNGQVVAAKAPSTPEVSKPEPAKAEATPTPPAPVAPTPAPTETAPAPVKADPQPETVAASPTLPLPPPSPAASPVASPPVGQTFAPNFLLSPSTQSSRRRPGPSLNPFLDIARQVKKPKAE